MSDYLFIYILKSLYSKCESNDEGIYSMLAIHKEKQESKCLESGDQGAQNIKEG